jgi:methylenetetrahydrofolate dehydrogenase (NADP+) / methenyltetrahydrofolate cyclohydrolase
VKILNGSELADFIKERQAHEARRLRQAAQVQPRLVILQGNNDQAPEEYLRGIQEYGADILVEIEVHAVMEVEIRQRLEELNIEPKVQGIMIMGLAQSELRQKVSTAKDIAGLAENSTFDTPLAIAINWLLAGYNINLPGKRIVIVGDGHESELLAKMWQNSQLEITSVNDSDKTLIATIHEADVIICNTNRPNLITPGMIKPDAIIVEAKQGSLDPSMWQLPNITITPENEGVEPLIVCALFDNVIRAAWEAVN